MQQEGCELLPHNSCQGGVGRNATEISASGFRRGIESLVEGEVQQRKGEALSLFSKDLGLHLDSRGALSSEQQGPAGQKRVLAGGGRSCALNDGKSVEGEASTLYALLPKAGV